jgi:glycogen(starch) synthase
VKILFSSHFFPPGVGGIEEVGGILAREFIHAGHEVIVVTQTQEVAQFPFQVWRQPNGDELMQLMRWSDVVFHNNLSLRTAWPLLVLKIVRPWVVAHHTWIARADGSRAAVDTLKRWSLRAASNIAVSHALAASLGVKARVIPNPYRADVFQVSNGGTREGVIFVGRLVSDKGADLLLEALALMRGPRATIVGDGPERTALEAQAKKLGLDVRFTGTMRDAALAGLLNEHKLLVVPSRWEEPFGIVALEGMACGCVPVVARSGGLPEAVGDAGVLFEKGNARAMADCMEQLLADETGLAGLRARAAAHLERHRPALIAAQYLEVLEEAAR